MVDFYPRGINNIMIIYHYTSQQAVLNIFESQSFWLTNVGHLNDPLEHKWFFKRALELHALEPITWVGQEFERRIRHKDHLINIGYMQSDDSYPDEASIFVASFSSVSDELHQWCKYSDKGMGVCLGFDRDALEKWMKEIQNPQTQTGFINYDLEKTDQIIKSSSEYPALEGIFHKTTSWESEKEYRVAIGGVSYTNYQFRQTNTTLLSYVSYPIPNFWDSVKEVWLGPLVSPQSYFSWSTLLSKYCRGDHLGKIKLLKSRIKLRAN